MLKEVTTTAMALVVLALMAAAVAIGWRFGNRQNWF
jgi:hypothetical protein